MFYVTYSSKSYKTQCHWGYPRTISGDSLTTIKLLSRICTYNHQTSSRYQLSHRRSGIPVMLQGCMCTSTATPTDTHLALGNPGCLGMPSSGISGLSRNGSQRTTKSNWSETSQGTKQIYANMTKSCEYSYMIHMSHTAGWFLAYQVGPKSLV